MVFWGASSVGISLLGVYVRNRSSEPEESLIGIWISSREEFCGEYICKLIWKQSIEHLFSLYDQWFSKLFNYLWNVYFHLIENCIFTQFSGGYSLPIVCQNKTQSNMATDIDEQPTISDVLLLRSHTTSGLITFYTAKSLYDMKFNKTFPNKPSNQPSIHSSCPFNQLSIVFLMFYHMGSHPRGTHSAIYVCTYGQQIEITSFIIIFNRIYRMLMTNNKTELIIDTKFSINWYIISTWINTNVREACIHSGVYI